MRCPREGSLRRTGGIDLGPPFRRRALQGRIDERQRYIWIFERGMPDVSIGTREHDLAAASQHLVASTRKEFWNAAWSDVGFFAWALREEQHRSRCETRSRTRRPEDRLLELTLRSQSLSRSAEKRHAVRGVGVAVPHGLRAKLPYCGRQSRSDHRLRGGLDAAVPHSRPGERCHRK